MQNFFSKILNQKKTLLFVFLFLVISGMILPKIALAVPEDPIGQNIDAALGTTQPASASNTKTAGTFECSSRMDIYCGLMVGFGDLITWLFWILAYFASMLFSFVVKEFLFNKPITTDPILQGGWANVRNLANMLIVLGFVIVGIATAIRYKDYEAKKLLLPLIIVALLVNFSGLLCGLMIDAANIIVKSLAHIDPNGSQGSRILTALEGGEKTFINSATTPAYYLGYSVFYGALYLSVAITFFYMSFVFIERYAILAILFILSPLAFAFWVFPASKKLWTEWWNHFLKWVFVGVQSMFFIWLATQMMGDVNASITKGILTGWMTLIVVLIIMIVGVKISIKSSPFLAAAAMGIVAGGAGLAMGAIAGGAKLGGKGAMAGIDKAGEKMGIGKLSTGIQNVKGGVGRAMERITGNTGATAMKESARVATEQKGMEAALNSGNATDKARVQQLARTGTGVRGAAAMGAIASAGQINETFKNDAGKAGQRLQYASQFGGENLFKTASKENPLFMASNTTAKKDIMSQNFPGTTRNYTEQEAEDKLVGAAYKSADVEARSKFSPEVIKDPRYLMNTTAKQMSKAGERMSADRVQAHKDLLGGTYGLNAQLSDPANAANPAKLTELQAKIDAIKTMH